MGFNWGGYAKEAKPQAGFVNALSGLPDGNYKFIIENAEQKENKGGKGGWIVAMKLAVLDGPHNGLKADRDSFITSQEQANRFLGDLAALGFDVEQWKRSDDTSGVFFDSCMSKALVCLAKMQFEGAKTTSADKKYHNVNIVKRLPDGIPEKIDLKELTERAEKIAF